MITSVTIQNFKCIRHAEIPLEPLTVFVGRNASGKTSVLEAIAYSMGHIAQQDPPFFSSENLFTGECHCDWLYTRGSTGPLQLRCTIDDRVFALTASREGRLPLEQPHLLGRQTWTIGITPRPGAHAPNDMRTAKSTVFLRLNAQRLARPSYSERIPPHMETDGGGLASVIASMAAGDPETFKALQEHLRSLIDGLERIRAHKAPVTLTEREVLRGDKGEFARQSDRTYSGDALLFDFANAESVAGHAVSEGTLILLGLLTSLLGPTKPRILLLDDLERSLHPLAQKSLVEVLRKIMQEFPDLQIIATTHSPYLLDQLRPEEIRLMALDDDGHSICGRLIDHPQFERWKDEMAPGELWSLFGEKWLADSAQGSEGSIAR